MRIPFLVAVAMVLGPLLARADETWRLDNLARISGYGVRTVGDPRVRPVADGGTAMAFDGAHDGIFVSSIPFAGVRAFTIEVLFSPAEGGLPAQRFVHVEDTHGRRATIETRTNGHGGWWLDTFLRTDPDPANRGLTLIDPERVHPTNRWYWVALRYDGTRMADFVNGVKELEAERTFAPFGQGTISIGMRQNLVYWFKGAVREIRFHSRALPDAQLQRMP